MIRVKASTNQQKLHSQANVVFGLGTSATQRRDPANAIAVRSDRQQVNAVMKRLLYYYTRNTTKGSGSQQLVAARSLLP